METVQQNFFTKQLSKLFSSEQKIMYVGHVAFYSVNESICARIEFKCSDTADRYDNVCVSIIKTDVGIIDKLILSFAELWGKKAMNGTYAWTYNHETKWYSFEPTQQEFESLGTAVMQYISLFGTKSQALSTAELTKMVREKYVACCFWTEEDLESLLNGEHYSDSEDEQAGNKIELTEDERAAYYRECEHGLEDAMCEAGWDVIESVLSGILINRANEQNGDS